MSRYLMTLQEYNRIYQVAAGVLSAVTRPEKACIFFACFGSMALNKHYKIPARAVAGGFALCVNDEPQVAFFGQPADGRVVTSADGFHMWVQTETHIIDFMAPMFPEAFADADQTLRVPRRMFQRTRASQAQSLNALNAPGDYYTLPDIELTEMLTDRFLNRAMDTDLLLAADHWFGDHRKDQQKSMVTEDSAGAPHSHSVLTTTCVASRIFSTSSAMTYVYSYGQHFARRYLLFSRFFLTKS